MHSVLFRANMILCIKGGKIKTSVLFFFQMKGGVFTELKNIEVVKRPLSDLKPYVGNVKKHPKSQIEKIKKSILEFGFNDPIAIDENMTIIEGHGRYEACKSLGVEEIPTIMLSGMSEEQIKAYTLVHNKLTLSTGFDLKKLKKELGNIGKFDLKPFKIDLSYIPEVDSKKETQEMVMNILNLGIAQFEGVGEYDIPVIEPVYELPEGIEEWIGFNYVLSDEHPENKAVHFFVDDYQFERVWNNPDKYIDKLKRYKCVLSPDFSPYGDMPFATQLFNHYRKHWVARYWQEHGITVIPTIRSSTDERSKLFYLDGEPFGSVIAYSSMWSSLDNKEIQDAMKWEWNNMVKVLKPKHIIIYGKKTPIMDKFKGKLTFIDTFADKRWNHSKKD